MTRPNGLSPKNTTVTTENTQFIPAGYIYKQVAKKPAWLEADIEDIYSVSSCVSAYFADYIDYWRHNNFWLFDDPKIIEEIANEHQIDLSGMQLFYYEEYELQFNKDESSWSDLQFELNFPTNVTIPNNRLLQGFDVATFWTGNMPECSPLSCNSLAEEIAVNKHCLFNTFIETKQALENGMFEHAEPGPYRIIAVYKVI